MSNDNTNERDALERMVNGTEADYKHLFTPPAVIPAAGPVAQVTDEMVSRFLGWKLPANFSPDAGITFKRVYNETSPFGPSTHEPMGTNLFDATQARAMLEYVIGADRTHE